MMWKPLYFNLPDNNYNTGNPGFTEDCDALLFPWCWLESLSLFWWSLHGAGANFPQPSCLLHPSNERAWLPNWSFQSKKWHVWSLPPFFPRLGGLCPLQRVPLRPCTNWTVTQFGWSVALERNLPISRGHCLSGELYYRNDFVILYYLK